MKSQASFAIFLSSALFALTAQAAGGPSERDYSSQLSQAADALVGAVSVNEGGLHSYQGIDHLGGICLVSVRFGTEDVTVEVKDGNGRATAAGVPAESSEITNIEINSNESSLGVEIQTGNATHQLHAVFDGATPGLGRLSSVYVSDQEHGNGSDFSADCANLRPLLKP